MEVFLFDRFDRAGLQPGQRSRTKISSKFSCPVFTWKHSSKSRESKSSSQRSAGGMVKTGFLRYQTAAWCCPYVYNHCLPVEGKWLNNDQKHVDSGSQRRFMPCDRKAVFSMLTMCCIIITCMTCQNSPHYVSPGWWTSIDTQHVQEINMPPRLFLMPMSYIMPLGTWPAVDDVVEVRKTVDMQTSDADTDLKEYDHVEW